MSLLVTVALAASALTICAVAARACLVVIVVEGQSMAPTLQEDDRVLVLKYGAPRWPRKNSLVVVRPRWSIGHEDADTITAAEPSLFIKRLVALSGERYRAPMARRAHTASGGPTTEREWTVPTGHCFVCGDNMDFSSDSREWGAIPYSSLYGVVLLRLPRRALPTATRAVESESFPGPALGQPAPPFSADTLDGDTISLDDLIGQTTALIFVRGSNACRQAVASYAKARAELRRAGLELVVVSLLSPDLTHAWIDDMRLEWPILTAPEDTHPMKTDYRVGRVPFFSTISTHGTVRASGYGSADYQHLLQGLETASNA